MSRASLFGVGPPSCLQGVLFFACQIKLSCNQASTLISHFRFLLQWDRTEDITHSPDISGAMTQIQPG